MYKYVFFKLKLFYLEWNVFIYWKLGWLMFFVENKNIKWSDFFKKRNIWFRNFLGNMYFWCVCFYFYSVSGGGFIFDNFR